MRAQVRCATEEEEKRAPQDVLATSFFPGDLDRVIILYSALLKLTEQEILGVLRHEVGHVLGFRHEHIWLSNGVLDNRIKDVPDGKSGEAHVTAFDPNSIMNYDYIERQFAAKAEAVLSKLDREGALFCYGPSDNKETLEVRAVGRL